jgi:hypothetical protein
MVIVNKTFEIKTCYEWLFVALCIQLAKRMRRVILSSVANLTTMLFPHDLINGTIFGKKL